MKQMLCVILAALLLASCFMGCAQGSSTEVRATQPAAQTATEPAEPGALTDYKVPARFTGEWTGLEDTFFVHADAEILLPDCDRMPKATVHPRAFNQEFADKVMEVFLKGNKFYAEPVPHKEYLREQLAHYEAIARGEIPYTHDGTIDRVPGIIEGLKESIETAPNPGDRFPAEKTFHYREYPEGTVSYGPKWQEIEGYAEVDGRNIHCHFTKPDDPVGEFGINYVKVWEEGYRDHASNPNSSRRSPFWFDAAEQPKPVPSFSEAQAEEMVDKLLEELGMTDFTMDYIEPVTFGGQDLNHPWHQVSHDPTGETGYDIQYVRKVGGGVLSHTTGNGSASEGLYEGSWSDEFIRILVKEDRVVYFEWRDPYTEPEIVEENVTLMPFEDIQAIFSKMIFVKNHFWLEANKINGFDVLHDVNVDKVQLTLMRTRPRDSFSEGTIIPVWDFWGTESGRSADEEHKDLVSGEVHYEVLLTLNAIDGTMVDRDLGY